MKKIFLILSVLLFICQGKTYVQNNSLTQFINPESKDTFDINLFKNPSKQFRLLSFWSWNDDLKDNELRWQIKQMDNEGWGGFFMHAREGLLTPYLSKAWFSCCKVAIDEAAKRGMHAWLYDENKWPSGTANFTIPFMDKAYRETHLFMVEDKIPQDTNDITIYKVLCKPKRALLQDRGQTNSIDSLPCSFTDITGKKNQWFNNEMTTLYFYKWKAPLGSVRFGGGSYVDLMNPDLTKTFIESTHEKYKQALGNNFGSTIPGIFTDDITLIWDLYGIKKNALPWTDNMPEIFKKWNGYNIEDNLEKLYFPLPGYEKVRVDFYRTVNRLFSENYWKVLYDWCDENNLGLTGHHMGDGLPFNDLMLDMQYEQIPGMDHLDFMLNHFLTLRSIISVAHQLGKKRTLCEAFAACGQNLTFEGQKWISDWLLVNGINTIAAHISMYSMEGERKRDHPPIFGPQQPWWKYNRYIADYQARVSYLLTRGHRATDILLLYPTESFGLSYTPNNKGNYEYLMNSFQASMRKLMENHLDFDLGSEEIMSKSGSVTQNKMKIGLAEYKIIVLPPTLTIRSTTFELLKKILDNRGNVFAIDRVPFFIDGISITDEQRNVFNKIQIISDSEMADDILSKYRPDIQINLADGKTADKIYYQQRVNKNDHVFFLTNIDLKETFPVNIILNGKGTLWKLDLNTGAKTPLLCENNEGNTVFHYSFAPAGSIALLLNTGVSSLVAGKQAFDNIEKTTLKMPLDSLWQISAKSENALTVDYCSYSTNGKDYSSPAYCLKVYEALKNKHSIKYLLYKFNIDSFNGFKTNLVVETPEKFTIKVNGKVVAYNDSTYFWDKSFRKTDITKLVKTGENKVELNLIDTTQTVRIEAIYITGDFRVKNTNDILFSLQPVKKQVEINDLVVNGYPFFAGTVELQKTISLKKDQITGNVYLKFQELDATVAEIFINDKPAGTLYWKPYEIEISKLLTTGKNSIRIQLTNSLHNLLGPFHNQKRENLRFVNFNSFRDYENWMDSYFFYPFGISNIIMEVVN